MDNELHEKHDPDDRSATSASDVELDRRLNELRNEPQDKPKKTKDLWIKITGLIIIPILLFLGYMALNLGYLEVFRNPHQPATTQIEDQEGAGAILEQPDQVAAEATDIGGQVVADNRENHEASLIDKAIARAVSLQQQGKKPQAIEKWRAVALVAEGIDNEQAAKAWFSVGYLSQDLEAKILAYDQAIRLTPDLAKAYNNRGNAKDDLKQYKDAIADYDEALRLKADYAVAYYNRGIAKKNLKQYKDAIADYDQAIRLTPDLAAAYNSLGNAKSDLKQYKDAIADYDEAIRLQPDFAEAYYNRGIAKNVLKQYKDAIADNDEAIRLQPDFAKAYNNRGNAKSDLKQYKDAIADYDEAIRLKPDYTAAYNNRGLAKKALGLKVEARKDFETALELARNANNEKLTAIADQALRDLDQDGGS